MSCGEGVDRAAGHQRDSQAQAAAGGGQQHQPDHPDPVRTQQRQQAGALGTLWPAGTSRPSRTPRGMIGQNPLPLEAVQSPSCRTPADRIHWRQPTKRGRGRGCGDQPSARTRWAAPKSRRKASKRPSAMAVRIRPIRAWKKARLCHESSTWPRISSDFTRWCR